MHGRMIDELRSNSTKQIGRKYPQRAAELAARDPSSLFPAFALDAYLRPCTSPLRDPTQGWPGFGRGVETLKRGRARHDGRGDLEGMAKACEKYFEWGTRDLVSRKFAGESVGLFGAEVMNEARERVRRATARRPMSPVLSGPSSQAESLSMITSFFSSALPIRAFSKSSPPAPSQAQHISLHIVKIHSIRDDPTNPELREYRISFRNDAYVARCQDAMEGSRVDPRDLPLADRQALGLVDRLDGDDDVGLPAIQTSGSTSAKSEIRVWVSEYLVLEGFPELVEAYEEELLTKATKKVRAPKKTSARPRPTRRAKVAVGEKSGAFVEFFTQRPIESSPIEEVEEVEERRPARRSNSVIDLSLSPSPRPARQKSPSLPELAGRLTRPCPTSSLSSVGSEHPHRDLLKPSRVVASSSSPVPQSRAKSKAKALRIMSPASSPLPRLVRAVSTVSGASASSRGKKDEPIDLCSSEDEPPRPPSDKSQIWRTPPSSPPSNRSSKLQTAGARGSWKVKTAATDTAQRRLDLPVVSATTTRVVAHGKGRFVDDPVWAI